MCVREREREGGRGREKERRLGGDLVESCNEPLDAEELRSGYHHPSLFPPCLRLIETPARARTSVRVYVQVSAHANCCTHRVVVRHKGMIFLSLPTVHPLVAVRALGNQWLEGFSPLSDRNNTKHTLAHGQPCLPEVDMSQLSPPPMHTSPP